MQNALFSSAVAAALRGFDPDFQVFLSESPDRTAELCMDSDGSIVIMEVLDAPPWDFESRIRELKRIRGWKDTCKAVFVVDENAGGPRADKVRQAKKDGLIDLFLYSSVSAAYLSAAVDAL